MHRHPEISKWAREEDGSYKRDLAGFALHVEWHPEPASAEDGKRRGFSWKCSTPDAKTLESEHVEEEIEHAMLGAEDAARAAGAIEEPEA